MKKLKNTGKGFSLVEVVVVMAIMALLATVAVPMLTSSSNSKTNDKYKQYCISALDSAASIAEAYSKGAKSAAGYDIAKNTGEPNWVGINQCLNADNPYNYKFKVSCTNTHYTVSEFSKLSGSSNPNGEEHKDIDTVVICYIYDDLERTITPIGAWFVKKAVVTVAYKYDYVLGKGIEITEKFTLPE